MLVQVILEVVNALVSWELGIHPTSANVDSETDDDNHEAPDVRLWAGNVSLLTVAMINKLWCTVHCCACREGNHGDVQTGEREYSQARQYSDLPIAPLISSL